MVHYKKNNELYHLNYITKLNDSILNYLFINEANIYNLTSIVISDVLINLFDISLFKWYFLGNLYHFNKKMILSHKVISIK